MFGHSVAQLQHPALKRGLITIAEQSAAQVLRDSHRGGVVLPTSELVDLRQRRGCDVKAGHPIPGMIGNLEQRQ